MSSVKRFFAAAWVGIGAFCLGFYLYNASFAHAQSTGYLHTSGSQILNSANQPVRLAGLNWYGFETTDEAVHGLWEQDYKTILNQAHSLGYNTIRIPLSSQMVESPIQPSDISFNNSSGSINSDLAGLNSLQILDRIVAYAGQIGLYVILDNHRSEAGSSAEANGLWYTTQYPESSWINDWVTLANRYKNSPAVIGMDLRNEPHAVGTGGACWGCGTATEDWQLAAERGGNAVLAVNPNLLIFVEGVSCAGNDCTWWGGNLKGAATHPVVLNLSNRLVYSAHEYGPNLDMQDWFNSSTTYASLTNLWTARWAFLSINGVAPVWLGEFGTTNNPSDISSTTPGSQGQYFSSMIEFLASNPRLAWTYWALNGEDHYNLLDSNYDATPASAAKQQALASIQAGSGSTAPSCKSAPTVPLALSATAISAGQIVLAWTADAIPSGCNVTYNVFSSKTANFVPATANLLKSGITTTSYPATSLTESTAYYFAVEALDAAGSSAASPDVSASTQAGTKAVPGAPLNLTANATSASAIQLNWQASPTSAVTYNVYRSATSGFTVAQGTRIASGVTAISYANTGLTASTQYFYLVTAVDAGGESLPSNQAPATTQHSAAAGAACHVVYTLQSQWNNGFQAGIEIDNTGTAALTNWTLTWTWPSGQSITQAWSSNLVQPGPAVNLSNASWNGTIAPGGNVTGIGFLASYNGASNTAPTAFYLNGVLCR